VQERNLVEFIKATESLRELWRDSARRALSWCVEREQEITLLSSGTKKSPGQDLHRVAGTPYRLSKELLEQETAKKALDYPFEGEERVKSLRGLSNRQAQDR
jgi:hypothetical protein